jgi:hypothetical protein
MPYFRSRNPHRMDGPAPDPPAPRVWTAKNEPGAFHFSEYGPGGWPIDARRAVGHAHPDGFTVRLTDPRTGQTTSGEAFTRERAVAIARRFCVRGAIPTRMRQEDRP